MMTGLKFKLKSVILMCEKEQVIMKKEWLWGPGRIAPEHKGLTKREYLERLAAVREQYLNKILRDLAPENIPYVVRIEKSRFDLLAELDRVSEEEFARPRSGVLACRNCPNEASCEAKSVCEGWSLADFAAHQLTHEEKNVDPEVNETLQHMADHDETHLRQVRDVVRRLAQAARQ
jgi:hypothetical protein